MVMHIQQRFPPLALTLRDFPYYTKIQVNKQIADFSFYCIFHKIIASVPTWRLYFFAVSVAYFIKVFTFSFTSVIFP